MYRNFNDYEIIYMISENNNENFFVLLEKYKPLIYKVVSKYQNVFKKYGYDMDDLLQLGYIALYKSSYFYNENKNARFITYLKKLIENTLLSEIKNNNTNKRMVLNNAISYDILVNDNSTYLDYFQDNKNNYLYYEEKRNFIYFKNTLDFYDAGIFEMYYNGFSIDEICKMFNNSKKKINKKIKIINEKYKKDILKNS